MRRTRAYCYRLRLELLEKREVEAVARASGLTINQVLTFSVRKGLPLAREAFCANASRLTNVEPVPDRVWRRIYSRKDEVDECSGEQLKAVQSKEF